MALGFLVFFLFAGSSLELETTQVIHVTTKCEEDTNAFLWELNQERPQEYAVRMYDAFGKMGSNVKGGNVNQLHGSRQQCQSALSSTFSGEYCQVLLQQEAVRYFVGICVPDSCREEDVEMLVLYGRLQIDQTSLIPPFPSILVNQTAQALLMTHCLSNTVSPDAFDIICLVVCCVMVTIPLAATLLTAIIRWKKHREVSPSLESSSINTDLNPMGPYGTLKSNGSSGSERNSGTLEEKDSTSHAPLCFPRSCVNRGLEALSLQNTSQGVLSTSSSITGYSSLNGIRVLSLFWIMCGHSTLFSMNNPDNKKPWEKAVKSNPLHVIDSAGPVFLAVDSFLVLGGLLSARSLLNSINRADGKLSISMVASYLLNRIKRIQPLHLFILCFTYGLTSLVRGGPDWFKIKTIAVGCKTYLWTNILLISNFFPTSQQTISWAWYLSLDFQCYATTPLLLYFYKLNKGVFAAVAGGLMLMTIAAGVITTALLQLPVFHPSALFNLDYASHYYMKPYTRYGPFLIGVLTAIYLTTKKDQVLMQKWQAALGWFCCLSLMAVVVGLAYVLQETPTSLSLPHAFYQGLHRPLWALAVTWIIVACEEGYGGFIKSFLSLGFWLPLSNMSFACYLLHPIIMNIYLGLQETPIHYTDLNFMYMFLGHVVLTLVGSYVLTVLIEKPYLLKYSRT
ncbi:O-acyltransferase like protein-like [Limanda limanda]|uniref:O-acyltransferase like protein-like n=1 Tax=Limanda limanda TaxID=27771 RepID=UPI0029C7475C|nr:O-acyltransferase like protein-like [Limanda limanda]